MWHVYREMNEGLGMKIKIGEWLHEYGGKSRRVQTVLK